MISNNLAILLEKTRRLQIECQDFEVSDNLIFALIAAEDQRFAFHCGVDFRSLGRVSWRFISCKSVEGGSTISMQLVRVLTGRYERTINRKFFEIIYAVWITLFIGKKDIPKMYLVVGYYGWRMNGLTQASKRLKINVKTATENQAAEIVARLKYPEPRFANANVRQKIATRVNHILLLQRKIDIGKSKLWKLLRFRAN